MKKILIINTVGFQYDGITSVILNYTKGMNREGLQFTFPIYEDINPTLKKELEVLGGVVTVPNRKKNVKSYIATLSYLLKERFDVVHVHGNSGTMLIETVVAKFRGVKKVILHAHSTSTNHPLLNAVMKQPMMILADELIACSRAAGTWLYGKRKYTILNNAIDTTKFRFNNENREQYRKEFCLKDEFLVGHIGHFSPQKNHFFLIDVFSEFHKLEPKSKLLLISDGPRFEEVKEKVAQLNLQDAVIFAGKRSDTASIYSAMDMFILPSNWEGLPLTMIEAQANGLPLLVSDVITKEAECTDRVFYKSLSDGAQLWAQYISEIKSCNYDRAVDTFECIADKGFHILQESEKLSVLYLK